MGIRSQIQKRNRFVSENREINTRQFALICGISCVIHLLFFLGIFGIHQFDFQKPRPRVVTVDLVSFVPGPASGVPEPEVVKKKAAPVKTADVNLNAKPVAQKPAEPAPVPVLKPDVSLKTKPKNIKDIMAARDKKAPPKPEPKPKKQNLKPKPDPQKELQKARQALAEKVEQQNQEQISQALERMKEAISEKEARPGPGAGEGPGGGRNVSDPEKLYQMVLASTIRQNWVFNDTLARMDKNLESRVLVKILKDGEIRDIIFETRSGNKYLDESVRKAILRSNPLPALPMGWTSYDVGFVFSPRGLK